MKSLFNYSTYREVLLAHIDSPEATRGTQARFAKAMGCQAAYLSQALKGKAELTEDHAIRLARHLNFSELETEYFLVLVRISRSGSPELREHLEGRRKQLVEQSASLGNRISAKKLQDEKLLAYYYASSVPSTVHVATSSPRFQTSKAIAERLGLPDPIIEEALMRLEKAGLIRRQGGKWIHSGGSLHLPADSPLKETLQAQRHTLALRALQTGNREDLHWSSVFTLDPESYRELKEHFLQQIENTHKRIHAGGSDELYGLSLDLFRVV